MAHIAVIGGGINGVMSAWALAKNGHHVALYEKDTLMAHTSSASSRLLHGGLRYLENGEWSLVKRALADRDWWLQQQPDLTHALPIVWPLYRGARRRRWQLKLGLSLYDTLARHSRQPCHHYLDRTSLLQNADGLRASGLLGGYCYYDGQMDDAALGRWAAQEAQAAGVTFSEHSPVEAVDTEGWLYTGGEHRHYDIVVNAGGPWAEQLLQHSGIPCPQALDTVRGSHIMLPRKLSRGYLLEVPGERRVVFVLPWQEQTLIGTTEVRQAPSDPVHCSAEEETYLLAVYNHYFEPAQSSDICHRYTGLRPLLHSSADPSCGSREHVILRNGRLLTILGGKWTTSPSLARELAATADRLLPSDGNLSQLAG